MTHRITAGLHKQKWRSKCVENTERGGYKPELSDPPGVEISKKLGGLAL